MFGRVWLGRCVCLVAVFAQAVYLHAVGFRLELVPYADLVLQALECFIRELDYLAAAGAYHVVVVFVCVDVFVVGMFFSKDYLPEVSAFYKQGECAVDGGLGDALVVLSEA